MPHIGYQWLSRTFGIQPVHPFAVSSEVGRVRSSTQDAGVRKEVYTEAYRPDASLSGHLTFAFRYEGVHLEFLARLCALPAVKSGLEAWIRREPTGAYARRACFFFEWLTGDSLDVASVTRGNYVEALDPDQFITGSAANNSRWRVKDNLPGTRDFCPIIRRTDLVQNVEAYDLQARLAELEADYGIDLLMRSAVWLTVKESRASFAIEREQDKEDRIRRFAAVMASECGLHEHPFSPATLDLLQRGILGDSALRHGVRSSPVYVGHTARYEPVVDYVAPHWTKVEPMLAGLAQFLVLTAGSSAIVRAAVASFGFVYIHPMADGNGRISRFLINDVLRRDGVVPYPLILPVSATITNSTYNRAAYDKVLERFSTPLMQRYSDQYRFGETILADDGIEYNLHFLAYDDALSAWRYPDLTAHVVYLAEVIDQTVALEMREEARFLRANTMARESIKNFLEAPDQELDGIIRSIRENGNAISNKLAKRYPLLIEKPQLGQRLVESVVNAFKTEP